MCDTNTIVNNVNHIDSSHSNASESNVIVYIIDCGVSVAIVLSNIIDSIFTENSEEDGIDDTTSDIPMESMFIQSTYSNQ